jgi:hypothetical protein
MTAKQAVLDKLHDLQVSALKGRNASGLGGVTEENIRKLLDRIAGEFHALTEMVVALPESEANANPWREAVIDACVINHLPWDDADPTQTLMKLVDWEIKTALDPAVSGDAQALIDRGRVVGMGDAVQAFARYQWFEENADIESVFHDDRVSIRFPVSDKLSGGFDTLTELVDAGLAAEQGAAEASGVFAEHVLGHLDYVPGKLDSTAPGQIWLQVDTSENNEQRHEAFPEDYDGVSWCAESVGGLEIAYVRADVAHRHMRSMASAPTDGTPVLLKFKTGNDLPERMEGFTARWFVGRYTDELTEWGFAAPVGYGGISTSWLACWMPVPNGTRQEPVHE